MPIAATPAPLSDHDHMLAWAMTLAAPVIAAGAAPGGLAAVIPAQVSSGADSDGRRVLYAPLEALGRLSCGLAPLLERLALEQLALEHPALEQLAHTPPLLNAIRQLLTAAVRPDGPQALNFSYGRQPLVDTAFLAQAVLRAPTALWHGLSPAGQDGLLAALQMARKIQPLFNNWLLFPAMIEALFARLGLPWDRMRVDYALRQTEAWYCGDGVYGDGPVLQADYYGSYVITPMLSDILSVVASHDPDWTALQHRFAQRQARQVELLERMIGPDGSFPPLGRSVVYRCAAFQPLAQLALQGRLPDCLPPGQARTALLAVISRTLRHPDTFDAGGWLRIGLNGYQPGMAETYISTGSLYLCATAFLPLGLPPTDRFWTEPAQPWTQARVWTLSATIAPDVALETRPTPTPA